MYKAEDADSLPPEIFLLPKPITIQLLQQTDNPNMSFLGYAAADWHLQLMIEN